MYRNNLEQIISIKGDLTKLLQK